MKLIRHDNEANRAWNIDETYLGPNSSPTQIHIVNVNDIIYNFAVGLYRVTFVDEDFIPTLEPWIPPNIREETINDTLWANLTANRISIGNRVMVNTSDSPYVVNFNGQYIIYNRDAVSAKLFRGTNTTNTGVVISRVYDGTGTLVSDSIPLQNVYPDNDAIKRPSTTNIDVELNAGEVVTLVHYSVTGAPIWAEQFIVTLSNAIRPQTTATRYLTDISIVSDLIDETDPLVIRNELYTTLSTILMKCRLHYTDGSYVDIDFDGSKAVLYNLDNFNSSAAGPSTSVTAAYYPSSTEPAINLAGNSSIPMLFKTYQLVNHTENADFALKLYVVPRYRSVVEGYDLSFYLGNMAYDDIVDVTAHVDYALINNNAFNGAAYGSTSVVQAVLRLDDVIPGLYPDHVHVQRFSLTLNAPTLGDSDGWVIDYTNDSVEMYGQGIVAWYNPAYRNLNIKSGQIRLSDWLDVMYRRSKPIFDEELLSSAPEPTHFEIAYGGITTRYTVSDWNSLISVPSQITAVNFSSMVLTWIRVDDGVDKYLSVTPMIIKTL